jgi:hypothetical protein
MGKVIVVVSALVDATIREGQADTTFILKRTMEELAEHIELTPIRAECLYFTQETIPHTNTTLNYLVRMLENPFLKVDKVCYITESGAKELPSIHYIIEEKGFTNWEVVVGFLTREYVTGVITGALRTDNFNKRRRALYRVPRSSYIQDRIKNKESLDEEYEDDEKVLKNVPPVDVPESTISDAEEVAPIIHVVGLVTEERTALTFLLAQYLAFTGKTIIIDKDSDYHTLTEFVTKSDVVCRNITISEFIENPNRVLEIVKTCAERLICFTAVERINYSYAFLCNVLYNNLSTKISYFIREDDFTEAPLTLPYTVVIPASVVGILKTCEQLDSNYTHLMRFVGVNLQSLPETKILNGNTMATILSDVLEIPISKATILNVRSLKIGGEAGYDLRSIIDLRQ